MLEVSSRNALLSRLEDSFGQRQDHEGVAIKAQVAAYIADFVQKLEAGPDANIAIPNEVSGLRRRYLDAVKANSVAKLRHARMLAHSPELNLNDKAESRTTDLLTARLDGLAKERQHSELDVINHHAHELIRILKATKASPSSLAKQEDFLQAETQSDHEEIARDAQEKLGSLQSAVLQARSQSNREKAQLESVQRATKSSNGVVGSEQARALEEVRTEVTAWLEEILGICNTGDESEPSENVQQQKRVTELQDLQAAYDLYVQSRITVLGALQRDSAGETSVVIGAGLAPADLLMRVTLPGVDDSMMEQEQLARVQESKQGLDQVQSYLGGALKEDNTQTVEILQRLADESQLLPAYPILARSDRFKAAIQTFGGKRTVQGHDQVMDHTEAWAFAANTSREASDAAMTKELEQGYRAMEGVQDNLKALSFLDSAAAGR